MTSTDEYDYQLPVELIAQHPLANRADARLMVVDRRTGIIDHYHVRDLTELLTAGDVLVLNDSKVIPARLVGHRTATGGRWQGLFLAADEEGNWRLLSKTRGHLAPGEEITLIDHAAREHTQLRFLTRLDEGQWAARPCSELSALELLEQVGRVPLPHYIRGGEMLPSDRTAYQTVFARESGSVAAPTAGLHLTRELLHQFAAAEITVHYVTLHVGVGTFRPISVAQVEDHRMHREWAAITPEVAHSLNTARAEGRRIIAGGTTTVRVLESAAVAGDLQAFVGETDLYIRPPYEFRVVDALLTNFHLPRSTLLVLARTFGGDELIKRAYEEAFAEQYRVFSYGDAMLIL